ncbi:glycosyltransferase family 2 protein [Thomasclavelia cocleata]|uniref:glycosyltransferase family 2 protein n=1 Tax=Thomasclavelia cocleata TaxID=69824 RepID=UPI00272BBDF3|nr:glycosyltransferase family 2 protein [Thomasclavelia cocleata]
MYKPLISIIVPIYNAEKKLERCLDHLVNQTFNEIEIILIDDGSIDMSRDICIKYMREYKNIIYKYQHNQGVSSARNLGISIAKGDYICFCDSDDYYELDALQKMYISIEEKNIELVIGSIKKQINQKEEITICGNFLNKSRKFLILKMFENYMINQVWGKLYKKEIIDKYKLSMKSDMQLGEDLEWNCRYLLHINKIISISDVVYNYVIENEESLSQRFHLNHYKNIEVSYCAMKRLFIKMNVNSYEMQLLYTRQGQRIISVMKMINKKDCTLSFKEKVRYMKEVMNLPSYMDCTRHDSFTAVWYKKFFYIINNPLLMTILISLKR